ncbi:MAG: molybdate ABC transporter substrate-binding protein [Deltaproteobacteria bacterium]|nr:MAG: molybdate ABC transporter substrate-binding protein [Deltaproteobacteria bacterium]
MRRPVLGLLMGLLMVGPLGGWGRVGAETITAFCGAATKPAMEEAARAFEGETGTKVYLNFGGSGTVLSQMKLSKTGDLFIPGTLDYMEKAKEEGLVHGETERILAYLIPAILVQRGNPKDIESLADLARPGIRVGIGNPEAVCVGLYAIELLQYNGLLEKVAGNIVTYAESCSKTAALVVLGAVDAVIGWRVFSKWHPRAIEAVYLRPEQIPRIAYVPGAISVFCKHRDSAQRFLDFLVSSEGRRIFARWGYLATEAEARRFAPQAKIRGEYRLPVAYYKLRGR